MVGRVWVMDMDGEKVLGMVCLKGLDGGEVVERWLEMVASW